MFLLRTTNIIVMIDSVVHYIIHYWQAISKFESLVNQIQKNARDIDQRLKMIESANLFKPPVPKADELPQCKVSLITCNHVLLYKPTVPKAVQLPQCKTITS